MKFTIYSSYLVYIILFEIWKYFENKFVFETSMLISLEYEIKNQKYLLNVS